MLVDDFFHVHNTKNKNKNPQKNAKYIINEICMSP
jgi:hypothetical protein